MGNVEKTVLVSDVLMEITIINALELIMLFLQKHIATTPPMFKVQLFFLPAVHLKPLEF